MPACSNWVSTRYTVARPMSERTSSRIRNTSSAVMWRWRALLEDLQDLQPRQSGLEPGALEFVDVGHRVVSPSRGWLSGRNPAATMGRSYRLPHSHARPDPSRCPPRFYPGFSRLAGGCPAGGCGYLDGARKLVDPYKNDVVQGNFVSREQVEFLKPGMTRQQVRDVLGTPLVASVFHADRWDYVFTLERRGAELQRYRLTVYFNGDLMDRVTGDTMPTRPNLFPASTRSKGRARCRYCRLPRTN